jgi:hypothetical protein
VFWFNSARVVWYLEKSSVPGPADTITVGAYCRKNNLGPLHPAVGLQLQFRADGTVITAADLADDEQLATKLPVGARISHLLKSGPQTIARIADVLDAKVDTVEKALKRGENKRFTRITGGDGVFRWALFDRRVA